MPLHRVSRIDLSARPKALRSISIGAGPTNGSEPTRKSKLRWVPSCTIQYLAESGKKVVSILNPTLTTVVLDVVLRQIEEGRNGSELGGPMSDRAVVTCTGLKGQ